MLAELYKKVSRLSRDWINGRKRKRKRKKKENVKGKKFKKKKILILIVPERGVCLCAGISGINTEPMCAVFFW